MKFDVATGKQAKAQGERAVLHQGVRREPGEGGARRTTGSSRSPPRCRPAPASTSSARRFRSAPSMSASPSSMRVTFAAGLATEGYKPFAAIYSTFLQRAYDQVVHDVAIQRLPVRFALDRAGLVGADGPTHAGSFDVAYLGCLPGFVLMAAADEAELVHMVATQVAIDDRPVGAALSARRRRRRRHAGVRRAARDRQGPNRARRHLGRAAVARHAAAGMPEGGRDAGRARPVRRRSPMRASPSRSTSIWCCGWRKRARGADHASRKARSAASAPMCCRRWPSTARSIAA